MNIFITNLDPGLCALDTFLAPKLGRKMILESTQLLSMHVRVFCANNQLEVPNHIYKMFNPNHDSRLWLDQKIDNFFWLYEYTNKLNQIYKHTSRQDHGSFLYAKNCYAFMRKHFPYSIFISKPFLAMPAYLKQQYAEPIEVDMVDHKTGVYTDRKRKRCYKVYNYDYAMMAYQSYLPTKPYWSPDLKFQEDI